MEYPYLGGIVLAFFGVTGIGALSWSVQCALLAAAPVESARWPIAYVLSQPNAAAAYEIKMSFAPAVVLSAVTLAVYLYCQVDWQGAGNFRQAAQNAPQILYVLESEGAQEWQAISAEASAVSWVADLKDRLTISPERPLGEDVTVAST